MDFFDEPVSFDFVRDLLNRDAGKFLEIEGPPDEADLDKLYAAIEHPLSGDYRAFLSEFGSAEFVNGNGQILGHSRDGERDLRAYKADAVIHGGLVLAVLNEGDEIYILQPDGSVKEVAAVGTIYPSFANFVADIMINFV